VEKQKKEVERVSKAKVTFSEMSLILLIIMMCIGAVGYFLLQAIQNNWWDIFNFILNYATWAKTTLVAV